MSTHISFPYNRCGITDRNKTTICKLGDLSTDKQIRCGNFWGSLCICDREVCHERQLLTKMIDKDSTRRELYICLNDLERLVIGHIRTLAATGKLSAKFFSFHTTYFDKRCCQHFSEMLYCQQHLILLPVSHLSAATTHHSPHHSVVASAPHCCHNSLQFCHSHTTIEYPSDQNLRVSVPRYSYKRSYDVWCMLFVVDVYFSVYEMRGSITL